MLKSNPLALQLDKFGKPSNLSHQGRGFFGLGYIPDLRASVAATQTKIQKEKEDIEIQKLPSFLQPVKRVIPWVHPYVTISSLAVILVSIPVLLGLAKRRVKQNPEYRMTENGSKTFLTYDVIKEFQAELDKLSEKHRNSCRLLKQDVDLLLSKFCKRKEFTLNDRKVLKVLAGRTVKNGNGA